MKKYLLSLPVLLFPYLVLAALVCLYTGFLMEEIFQSNGFLLIGAVLLCAVAAAGFAAVVCGCALAKRTSGQEMARLNMVIKLCQIPAYLIIFALGLFCLISIWGILLTLILAAVDCFTIAMTGLIGSVSAFRSYRERKLAKGAAVRAAICQFIFCVDVFACVKLYLDSRKAPACGQAIVNP